MQVLGYGEDALSYWLLTQKITEFLDLLNDDTPLDEVVAIYRPSFGRSASHDGPSPQIRSEFGEFDAIIASAQAVYLIESKWDGAGAIRGGVLQLREEQIHRHRVFEWYLRTWWRAGAMPWGQFITDHGSTFQSTFPNTAIAQETSTSLASNLFYLLDRFGNMKCREVVNVLVYFEKQTRSNRFAVEPSDFRLVKLNYTTQGDGGYILMT